MEGDDVEEEEDEDEDVKGNELRIHRTISCLSYTLERNLLILFAVELSSVGLEDNEGKARSRLAFS